MGEAPGRAGRIVAAAALTTFVLLQALRVWFPTVLFVVGDAGETSALVMGGFALGCLLVGPLAAVLMSRDGTRTWMIGAAALAVGHAAFLVFTDGGLPQAVTSSVAVIGGTMALTALAAVPVPGTRARAGIVLGLAVEVSLHATLGSHTLAWRPGVIATTVSLLLVVLMLATVRSAVRQVRRTEPLAPSGRTWPWLVLAPHLLLVLVLAGVPGRAAVATGWSPAFVTAAVVAGQALAVLAVLLAPRLTPIPAAAAGAGLTLVGATGALEAAGVTSVVAQAALAAGLAIIAVAEAPTPENAPPRRRSAATAAGVFGFGVLTFIYYAGYDLHLGFYNRAVLLVAAVAAAALAVLAARTRALATTLRPALDRRRLSRAVAVLSVLVAVSGAVRLGDTAPAPAPGAPGAPIRLMLYNVHMGYDVDGRFSVPHIADVIRTEQPDIVVLNEVDRGWLTTGGHDVLQLLVDDLGFHAVFAPGADEVWGNALLTRFPVTELTTRQLPRGNDPMRRGQLAAIVDVAPDRQLAVVGTHLTHIEDQGATRLPQARAVAGTVAWLHERGVPTAVMGDLNAEPGSAEIQTFGSFVEPTHGPGQPTWPSWDPQVQIDHILVSPAIEVLDAAVIDTQASDHLPLVVTVQLPDA